MDNNIVLKIKDSVDLFLTDDLLLTVYYMNTRVRKTFKVNRLTISLLEAIDGKSNLYELSAIINLQPSDIKILIKALLHHRIITPVYNKNNKAVSARYSRQLNYFSEFFETEEEGYLAQEKLSKYKILVLGCGGVGSTIAIQLAMAGIKNFILFDDNIVRNSDISRHLFFREKNIGLHKTEALDYF